MSNNALISLVVPSYNVEKYISNCLDTILAQTYKNLEIICVNDGSTDSTGDIINSYAAKDSRIVVITKANGGLSSARNAGIDIATGEYIALIDSDDYISQEYCERLVTLINEYGADIARCRGRGVDSMDYFEPKSETAPNITVRSKFEALDIFYDGKFYGWYADDAPAVWNCLYRKKIFDELRFNESLPRNEDESFTQRAIGEAEKVVYTDERLYYYYKRPGSLSFENAKDEYRLYIMKTVYADHQEYFKRKGYENIRQKNLKAACNNFAEVYLSTKKDNVKKDSVALFKKYYADIEDKPKNLKLFNWSPKIYSVVSRAKK